MKDSGRWVLGGCRTCGSTPGPSLPYRQASGTYAVVSLVVIVTHGLEIPRTTDPVSPPRNDIAR